jgi:peptide/nickel transport system permease protein
MSEGHHRRSDVALRVGMAVLVLLVVAATIGLFWTPYDPTAQNFTVRLSPPSLAHPLGTDSFGRDTLSRLLAGAANTLLVGLVSVAIGAGLGTLIGAVAGFTETVLDDALMRVTDALTAFPTVLLALLIAAAMRPGLGSAMLAVGLSSVPTFARLARAGVMTTRPLTFVEGARALGASEARVLARHVMPSVLPAIVVQASVAFAGAVLAEAALSYLGLGAQPPQPSWGSMLREAQDAIYTTAWPAVFPGLATAVTVLGLNLLGDALRDRLDPRLR